MEHAMRHAVIFLLLTLLIIFNMLDTGWTQEIKMSAETEECLGCHSYIQPGLVESWALSRHSKTTPDQGLQKPALERRISSAQIDSSLRFVTVGCYECHSLNTDKHQDAFEHNGYVINVIVSPNDCATCHREEREQYSRNLMAHAYSNLVDNTLYQDFIKVINNPYKYTDHAVEMGQTDMLTEYESCLYCHGSKVTVSGQIVRETGFGEYKFPVLEGWPNQGVGRVNPDGSLGACSACHTRHAFSIETARKPYTCSECHKGPDVPAFKVYEVSKHGNIFKTKADNFEFNKVSWTLGKDFTVPTCAVCHASLIVSPDNEVIVERSHQFSDRLSWRLFGVPYAHPHPVEANLSDVINTAGLPIATELDGTPVAEFVINEEQQQARQAKMKTICLGCHSTSWVDNHFKRLDNTIQKTNDITFQGTQILSQIWEEGFAEGLPQKSNIFDEEVERMWVDIWLFYANSTRFASAMAGGGDYGVFANGRYQTTEQLYKLLEKYKLYKHIQSK